MGHRVTLRDLRDLRGLVIDRPPRSMNAGASSGWWASGVRTARRHRIPSRQAEQHVGKRSPIRHRAHLGVQAVTLEAREPLVHGPEIFALAPRAEDQRFEAVADPHGGKAPACGGVGCVEGALCKRAGPSGASGGPPGASPDRREVARVRERVLD